MDQLDAHQRAQDIFAGVLAAVKPDQLSLRSPCDEWDAQGVIGGNQWVRELAGLDAVDLPDDLGAAHAASAAGAQAVFAAPDGLTRMFELPFGTLPGTAFIGLRTSDVFAHAWDLAKTTGQSTDLDEELAQHSLEFSRAVMAPQFRGPGRPFGEEAQCPDGRPRADHLAAFLGRSVD
jgi:uncharacterized protein (TIGR03086 family)